MRGRYERPLARPPPEQPRRRIPARPAGTAHLALRQALQGLLQPLGALLGRQRQDALGHGAAGPPGTARDRRAAAPCPEIPARKCPCVTRGTAPAPGARCPPRHPRGCGFESCGGSVTESQNGSGWKRPRWAPGPVSLLKHGPRAHGTGLQPDGHGISPVRETPQPLWASCCGAWSLHSEKVHGEGACGVDSRGYRGIWHKVPIQGHTAWAASATHVRFRYIRVNPLIPGDMRNVPFSVPGRVARL